MRRADPVGALLGVFDRRLQQAAQPLSVLGTVAETAPNLVVDLDTGQRIYNPYVASGQSVHDNDRCVMMPIQEGHDFALIGALHLLVIRHIITSDDGITWRIQAETPFSDFVSEPWVRYGGGIWLASALGASVVRSVDGTTFQDTTNIPSPGLGYYFQGDFNGADKWAIPAQPYPIYPSVYTSDENALNFTQDLVGNLFRLIVFGGGYFVTWVPAYEQIWRSTDGVFWAGALNPGGVQLFDFHWNGTMWMAAGNGNSSTVSGVFVSFDSGDNWTDSGGLFTALLRAVTYSPTLDMWAAGGVSDPAILTSTDNGVTWDAPTTPFTIDSPSVDDSEVSDLVWDSESALFVAVGYTVSYADPEEPHTPVVATSPDGVTWTSRALIGLAGAGDIHGVDVDDDGHFVAVGSVLAEV